MKKNIGDHCIPSYIEIPETLHHEQNLLIGMIDYIKEISHTQHCLMRKNFSGYSAVCIKKNNHSLIGQEYYFTPNTIPFSKVSKKLEYEYPTKINLLNFVEYSFDYSDGEWEANVFDKVTCAYYVGGDKIYKKNTYFGFQNSEVNAVKEHLNKGLLSLEKSELNELLQWHSFQRRDGNIIIGRKENAESIFYSKVNFLGFLKFIQKFGWDKYIGGYIKKYQKYLKYYVFNINIQYSYKNGKLNIDKTSIYGIV